MTLLKYTKAAAFLTCLFSLSLGAAAILLADFGAPAWVVFLTQAWFWTIGLPTMVGVLVVTAAWGIPGWTALPLWLFVVCASLAACVLQTAFFLLLNRGWKRFDVRES